jgi:hypothetical protein
VGNRQGKLLEKGASGWIGDSDVYNFMTPKDAALAVIFFTFCDVGFFEH